MAEPNTPEQAVMTFKELLVNERFYFACDERRRGCTKGRDCPDGHGRYGVDCERDRIFYRIAPEGQCLEVAVWRPHEIADEAPHETAAKAEMEARHNPQRKEFWERGGIINLDYKANE